MLYVPQQEHGGLDNQIAFKHDEGKLMSTNGSYYSCCFDQLLLFDSSHHFGFSQLCTVDLEHVQNRLKKI